MSFWYILCACCMVVTGFISLVFVCLFVNRVWRVLVNGEDMLGEMVLCFIVATFLFGITVFISTNL